LSSRPYIGSSRVGSQLRLQPLGSESRSLSQVELSARGKIRLATWRGRIYVAALDANQSPLVKRHERRRRCPRATTTEEMAVTNRRTRLMPIAGLNLVSPYADHQRRRHGHNRESPIGGEVHDGREGLRRSHRQAQARKEAKAAKSL
jgi:hypothetical protein